MPRKDARHKHLLGVRSEQKAFLGIDAIAIAKGPHMGEILLTQESKTKLKFETNEDPPRKGICHYHRRYNEITGKFFFECAKIKWL